MVVGGKVVKPSGPAKRPNTRKVDLNLAQRRAMGTLLREITTLINERNALLVEIAEGAGLKGQVQPVDIAPDGASVVFAFDPAVQADEGESECSQPPPSET